MERRDRRLRVVAGGGAGIVLLLALLALVLKPLYAVDADTSEQVRLTADLLAVSEVTAERADVLVRLGQRLTELAEALLAEVREIRRRIPDNPSGALSPTA